MINSNYMNMDIDALADEIRNADMWDTDMVETLAYRLGVDVSDCEDCEAAAAKILAETGVDID